MERKLQWLVTAVLNKYKLGMALTGSGQTDLQSWEVTLRFQEDVEGGDLLGRAEPEECSMMWFSENS